MAVALIRLPFILGFDDSTAALLFYEIVGAGPLATLATRFEPRVSEARARPLGVRASAAPPLWRGSDGVQVVHARLAVGARTPRTAPSCQRRTPYRHGPRRGGPRGARIRRRTYDAHDDACPRSPSGMTSRPVSATGHDATGRGARFVRRRVARSGFRVLVVGRAVAA